MSPVAFCGQKSRLFCNLQKTVCLILFVAFVTSVLKLHTSLLSHDVNSLPSGSYLNLKAEITGIQKRSSKTQKWIVFFVQNIQEDSLSVLGKRFHDFFFMLVVPFSNVSKPQRTERRGEIWTEAEIDLLYNMSGLTIIAKAYLYAINHHAAWIYTHPPVDAESLHALYPPTISTRGQRLVLEDESGHFDARLHFGCSNGESPRRMNSSQHKYTLSSARNIPTYIHASALIHSPESDSHTTATGTCDDMAGPVTLSHGLFTDISLNSIMFHRNAFWALPVTGVVPERWMHVLQWLVWKTGGRITVDLGPVSDIDKKVPDTPLALFVCEYDATFIDCVQTLLLNHLPNEVDFQKLVKAWLVIIDSTYLKLPKINGVSSADEKMQGTRVIYEPVVVSLKHADKMRGRSLFPAINIDSSIRLYAKTCLLEGLADIDKRKFRYGFAKSLDLSDYRGSQFSRIVLVITFNNPIYSVIPYLELLYRPFFQHIVYCGPVLLNDPGLQLEYQLNFVVYTTTPMGHSPGAFNYECVGLASLFFHPRTVDGFLVTSDDLLILVPKFVDAPHDSIWFLPEEEIRTGELRTRRECRLGMCDFHPHWHWWDDYATSIMRALDSLAATRNGGDQLFVQCHRNLILRNGATMRANGGFSDIYYIPESLVEDFSKLASYFIEHLVFLEIAVPTILRCLVEPSQVWSHLAGLQIWTIEHRDEPWLYFDRAHLFEKMFLHPTKWSGLTGHRNRSLTLANEAKALTEVYCWKILPYLHDPLARLPV